MAVQSRSWLRVSTLSALCAGAAMAAANSDSDGSDYQSTIAAPVAPPMLGIEMSPVPTNVQEQDGLNPHQGVYVQNTFNNTAAASMGVQPGDVVLQVNGSPIGSMSDLRNEIGMNAVGDPVDVVVQRGGQQLAMNAPLQPWPSDIPKERLDPAAEQRFRDWQADRQKQDQEQLDALSQAASDLGATLPGKAGLSPSAQTLADELDGLRAWVLSYSIPRPAPGQAPAPVVAALTPASATVATSSKPAWVMSWSNHAAPSAIGANP